MPSEIIHIQETDSTNNYLRQLLSEKILKEGTVVYTGFQTAGKGQRGNGWESERDENLLFSIVFYPRFIKANEQFIISQVISLGVADALSYYTDKITIKWPNDVYWKDRKICGILIENTLRGDLIKESVCGIGINVNQEDFRSNAPNPVSLKQVTSRTYDLNALLEQVRQRILLYYSCLQEGKTDAIRSKYKSLLYRKEGYHLYNDGTQDFRARIKDIETNGMLVLETSNGTERRFAFKEIKYILSD